MRTMSILGTIALGLILIQIHPAHGVGPLPGAATHEELGRAIDDLVGQIQRLGDRWRGHFSESYAERPVISLMLVHREELALSAAQVQSLERIRSEFQREAIRRDADLRVAEMDLAALLKTDPVDLAKVEAKIREMERGRADLRLARIRTIEQAKAQLSPEQRAKLVTLLAEPGPPRVGPSGRPDSRPARPPTF